MDQSILVTELRFAPMSEPLSAEPRIPAVRFRRKAQRAREARENRVRILSREETEGRELDDILLDKGPVWKAGDLELYSVNRGRFIAFRGRDLHPAFESYWFAFKTTVRKINPPRRKINTTTVYGSFSGVWRPCAPDDTVIQRSLCDLVQSVICGSPPPDLDEVGENGVRLLEAMQSAFSQMDDDFRRYEDCRAGRLWVMNPPESALQTILRSRMPTPQKITAVYKLVSGDLFPIQWSKLRELLSDPVLSNDRQELERLAIEATIDAAIQASDKEYLIELLHDLESETLSESPAVSRARLALSDEDRKWEPQIDFSGVPWYQIRFGKDREAAPPPADGAV
jgi:hypothetical protein